MTIEVQQSDLFTGLTPQTLTNCINGEGSRSTGDIVVQRMGDKFIIRDGNHRHAQKYLMYHSFPAVLFVPESLFMG